MALDERLRSRLVEGRVSYEILPHHEVFTARETARATHVAERQLAKVVVVRDRQGAPLMVALPAACRLDLAAVARAVDKPHLELVPETEMGALFPDCELGAMPPFGDLYGMPLVVDACFDRGGTLYFQAGNHHEVVRMAFRDYERLAAPRVREVCTHAREKLVTE